MATTAYTADAGEQLDQVEDLDAGYSAQRSVKSSSKASKGTARTRAQGAPSAGQ
jgi:hypothetical protein